MEPRIEIIGEKKLVGKRLKMSLSGNRTGELWQSFLSRRKEIEGAIGTELYSMQIYDDSYFRNFNPHAEFEKWATTEVQDFENVPVEMETFVLKSGLYAVFLHKGAASAGAETFRYIFEKWLPDSGYLLDNRPHFEVLGEKYKNDDPSSEEEIWIPIKLKSANHN